jgi:hypothetical protein
MMNRFCEIEKEQIFKLIYTLDSVEMQQPCVFMLAARIWPRIEVTINMFDQNFQVLFNFTPTIQKKTNNY